MSRVFLPTQLQSYAGGATHVAASGATVDQILRDLDGRFPGIRFRIVDEQDRIRRHMRIFVGAEAVGDIGRALGETDEVLIFGALSGG